jgi:hypothetical protein
MEAKNAIIQKVYYESFGSIKQVLQDAKAIDPTIKQQDIKTWKDRTLHRKINLKGMNSFVASKPKEEYQMDLFAMPIVKKGDTINKKRRPGEGMDGVLMKIGTTKLFKFGLLMVDIFTKFVAIIPLVDNTTGTLLTGLKQCLLEMRGNPETIYSDAEGAMGSKVMTEWLEKQNIRLLSTRIHAAFAERHIRTVKDMLHKRMDHKNIHINQWQVLLPEILDRYNTKMIHSATGMTPIDAMKDENEALVKGRLQVNRLSSRRYPEIVVGDRVRIFQKKDKLDKERVSTWSTQVYIVENINESMGQLYYKLSPQPLNWKSDLQRSEILKLT